MITQDTRAFSYHIPWRSRSVHAGFHRGTQRGMGDEFKGVVSLIDYPDPRRMDLRQTLRDPYEQIQVKLFNQNNITPIYAVCDLSSSMQFGGKTTKLDLVKQIATSIANSALETGDMFGFIPYACSVLEDLTCSLSHPTEETFKLIQRASAYQNMRVSSEGVLEVPQYLSINKGLVFWVSDFHMPTSLIEQAMNVLSAHQVIPVVLWDEREYKKLPKFGFGNLIDPETGYHRTIFFRESVKKQFELAFVKRKQELKALFSRFESQAIFFNDKYDSEVMSEYFLDMMG